MGKDGVTIISPERINGYRKTSRDIYVPTNESIIKHVNELIPSNIPVKYIEQGKEMAIIEAAHKNHFPVLLSGPTGIGKSLLVMNYAYENKLPLLTMTAHEDLTDGKIRGTCDILVVPALHEESTQLYDMKIKTFSPTHLTLAAMSPIPVLLFIDELHKIRKGVSSLLHSIANERMLYCHELTGENYKLHPDTLVIAAVNPNYGVDGIEMIDPALRQRFTTIDLEMPTGENLKTILKENIGPKYEAYTELIEALVSVQNDIVSALKKDLKTAAGVIDPRLKDSATLNAIIEAPSPRLLVKTLKQIIDGGLEIMTAIETDFVNPIINDFGDAKKAILEVIKAHIPLKFQPK